MKSRDRGYYLTFYFLGRRVLTGCGHILCLLYTLQLHTLEASSSGSQKPPQDLEAVVQCLSKDDANLPAELMALQIAIEACIGMFGST